MYIWIALGSAIGGMARYWCTSTIAQTTSGAFPWGTMAVNIIGAFVLGFVASMEGAQWPIFNKPEARQFLMVGLCGGYTTFSAFSLETLYLIQDGAILQALFNVLASVSFCLICVWLGYLLATWFNKILSP